MRSAEDSDPELFGHVIFCLLIFLPKICAFLSNFATHRCRKVQRIPEPNRILYVCHET